MKSLSWFKPYFIRGMMLSVVPGFLISGMMPDVHRAQIWFFSIWAVILVCKPIVEDWGWIAGCTLAWAVIGAVRVFAAPISPYEFWSDHTILSLDYESLYALMTLIFATVVGCSKPRILMDILSVAAVADAIWMMFSFIKTGKTYGALGGDSINAFFLASMTPMIAHNSPKWSVKYRFARWACVAFCASVIFMSRSSAGIFGFVLGILAYGASSVQFWRACWPAGIATVCGILIMGKDSFDSHGRSYIWDLALKHIGPHGLFTTSVNSIYGAGLGAWHYLGPYWQRLDDPNQTKVFFTFLHNDWLQIYFELGAVGLLLTASLFFQCLWNSRKRPWLFSSVAVYGLMMCVQIPLRLPVTQVLGVLLIAESLDE